MQRLLLAFLVLVFVVSCKKDKYTTAPQLDFIKFTYNAADNTVQYLTAPKAIIEVRDKEGDIGYIPNVDTSILYVVNPLVNKIDSIQNFPDISSVAGKTFKAKVEINLFSVLVPNDSLGFRQRPFTDTIRFQIYLKDFAGNKSNVLQTDPFIFTCL